MEANNKIFVCKRQLQNVYNHSAILAKEDEVKSLMNELKVLEHEKEGLMNIAKGQGKALKVVRNNDLCL